MIIKNKLDKEDYINMKALLLLNYEIFLVFLATS